GLRSRGTPVMTLPVSDHLPPEAAMSDWILQIQSLQVDLPLQGGGALRVLNGIDLKVERGAFVAILGPSGSGKTTLLRAIAGLIPPRAGSVTVRPSRDGKQPLLPSLSMNFQRLVLLPWLNVRPKQGIQVPLARR